jgi:hypothetical protein
MMDAEVHVAPVLLIKHAKTISALVACPTVLARTAVTMDAAASVGYVPLERFVIRTTSA